MFANEKTPLRGSDNFLPYASMSDHHSRFRRKLKQYQCMICTTIILSFSLAIVIALLSYPDPMDGPEFDSEQNLLQQPLRKEGAVRSSLVLNAVGNMKAPNLSTAESLSDSKEDSPILPNQELGMKKEPVCAESRYRSVSGVCNNLLHPTWGASGQLLKRLVSPDYCDGVSSSRCSTSKFQLPSPFYITSRIRPHNAGNLQQYTNQDSVITKLLWGEFIYHDLVDMPEFGSVQQLNMATSFLDGSNIYGHGNDAERKSRTFFNGELLIANENEYVANSTSYRSNDIKCHQRSLDFQLFYRVMRKQHNLVASKLKLINPHWREETLYHETKRIIIAQIQHVTYNEFLNVIGEYKIGESTLKPYKDGFNNKYSESVDPSVSDAFATATLKSVLVLLSETISESRDERCDFFSLAHGIQRGRDYGIPGYTKWREYCRLHKPINFMELRQLMETNVTETLQDIYIDINDIDLSVGLISEAPVGGSLFGELGLCLMADQFERLKHGDRFWYEVDQLPQRFSEEQLSEIRKTTISKLICDNLETDKIFFDSENSLDCSTIPKINLKQWEEVEPAEKYLTHLNVKASAPEISKSLDDNSESIETNLNKGTYGKQVVNNSIKEQKSLLTKSKNTTSNIVKRSTSFMMNVVNVTAKINGESIYEVYNQRPPILMPLDRVIDPNSYTTSTDINFIGTIDGNQLTGNIDLLLQNLDDYVGQKEDLSIHLMGDISFNWGTTFELDGNIQYKCKVLFQSYAKMLSQGLSEQNVFVESNIIKEGLKISDEQCTIMLVGMNYQRPFYCSIFPWWCLEGKFFYWSGEAKLVFKSTTNIPIVTSSSKINNGGMKLHSVKQKSQDVVVDKLFASVTVVSGSISGSFKNGDVLELFNGFPPIDIPLDHIISPNAYDISSEIIFSGAPSNDNSIFGKFSVPYYPEVGTALEKSFSANFTFDVIYKYGGSIGIINPSKTYVCPLMFPSIKKSPAVTESVSTNTMLPIQTLKGKTPFGESCSVMLGGYYKSSSFFCYITPWWCSSEKVFVWTGDIEFTIKNKYNSTVSVSNDTVKRQSVSGVNTNLVIGTPFQNEGLDYEEKFCCAHRLGGKVRKGWIQIKNSGLFQTSKTIWSGELPTAIKMPIFWKPGTSEDQADLSDVFGHEVIWTCSIFQSSLQGSFLFPQYVGHGPQPMVNWIKGKFFLELLLEENVSLYKTIVPGSSYRSHVNFHTEHSPDLVPFSNYPLKGGLTPDQLSGIRAPLILLGKYTSDNQSFMWNGSFIIVFTKTTTGYYYL